MKGRRSKDLVDAQQTAYFAPEPSHLCQSLRYSWAGGVPRRRSLFLLSPAAKTEDLIPSGGSRRRESSVMRFQAHVSSIFERCLYPSGFQT